MVDISWSHWAPFTLKDVKARRRIQTREEVLKGILRNAAIDLRDLRVVDSCERLHSKQMAKGTSLALEPKKKDARSASPAIKLKPCVSIIPSVIVQSSVPAPVELIVPAPVELTLPAPVELTLLAPVELIIPAPVELTLPAPVELIVPAPVELIVPAPVELIVPAPVELIVPAPVELTLPAPVELTLPAPVELIVPVLVQSSFVQSSFVQSTLPSPLESLLPVQSTLLPPLECLVPSFESTLPAPLECLDPGFASTLPPPLESTLPPPLDETMPDVTDEDSLFFSKETFQDLGWDSFSLEKFDEDLRLDITVGDDIEHGVFRVIPPQQRDFGVITHVSAGFKVFSADGFIAEDAFSMSLKWCDEKLYGVVTKPFAGYANFGVEVKLQIPKALKDEMETAEALAVLLFYLLRQKFASHAYYNHLIDLKFVDLSQEVLNNFKNIRFVELVKSYAYVLFSSFEKLAASATVPM